MDLSEAVEIAVALIQADPAADDAALVRDLVNCGVAEDTAVRLVQFVPIAFTRFLYRASGARFADEYVVLGPDHRAAARRPVAGEPAFREAWAHCERAAAGGAGDGYFEATAARSGGYRAIQELIGRGLGLAGIVTSPPVLPG
jgi:hypothetical protein